MKKAMFALAAMMVAGFAGAVTLSWTGNGSHTLDEAITFKDGYNYTLTLRIVGGEAAHTSMNAASGNCHVFTIGCAGNTSLNMDVRLPNTWKMGAGINGGNWNALRFNNVMPANGEKDLTFVITGIGTEDGKLGSITFTYNNETITADTSLEVGSIESVTVLNISGGYDFSATKTTLSVAALPEPTVLALLALGVAGVALKRKVA